MMAYETRLVGLDIGGSKTHAVAVGRSGSLPAQEVMAGSANLSSVGITEAGRQLDSVFDGLGRDGIAAVCAGAAGVDTPEQEQRLQRLIQSKVPSARVSIVHDTHLILAAAGVEHGIAVISGTGSVAWGRTPAGATARAGGWGYLLGDEGSGYWVGRRAVQHALALADRGERPDRLAQQLAADCGLQDPGQLLDHFYAQSERRYWAGHSRLVFELAGDGDPASVGILAEASDALAGLVRTVGDRLGSTGPVVLGGGLIVHQPLLQEMLKDNLAGAGYADSRVLHRDPAHGAVDLARRLVDTSAPA